MQLIRLLDTEIEARRQQVARYRFRDRDIDFRPTIDFDQELARALGQRLHEFGAAAIDTHIASMTSLRDDLLDGRLAGHQGSTDTEIEGTLR